MEDRAILLKKAAESIDLILTKEQEAQFLGYLNLLQERNEQFNLVSNSETEEVIRRHFIDSVVIHKQLAEYLAGNKEDNMLDIGAGAGFPSIPLKIIFPGIRLTLIEATKKKVEFLKEVAEQLMLDKISVIWGRSEDYAHQSLYREKYDIVVARAVAEMNTLIELALPFLRIGGVFVAYKGPKSSEELGKAKEAVAELGGEQGDILQINLGGLDRTLIFIRKRRVSPSKYPRKAGIPQKRPL